MLYQRSTVPPVLEWIQRISVMNYSFALLVLNQVGYVSEATRDFLLDFLEVDSEQFKPFLVSLICLSIVYRLLAMAVLMLRVRFLSKPQ